MTPDQERWAEALQVIKMKGSGAEAFVAARLTALHHDPVGCERWRAIAARIAELRAAERAARQ